MPADRDTTTETILVVDDNLQNRLVVEGHLVAEGYRVIQAENGREAVEIFASDPADLVLLDVVMPVMDGFEACRHIRAMDRGREVPILFVTAHGDLQTHEKAIESGADDFLSKPIQCVELLLRAKSLLRIRRLKDELVRSNVFIASQRDALLRAQEEKRRLSAMIVHDLRGPLGCVLGNADYVLDSASLTECLRQALRDIHASADTMDRMLNDLLDIARSEDGALSPKLKPVDVLDLLEEVRSYLRGQRAEFPPSDHRRYPTGAGTGSGRQRPHSPRHREPGGELDQVRSSRDGHSAGGVVGGWGTGALQSSGLRSRRAVRVPIEDLRSVCTTRSRQPRALSGRPRCGARLLPARHRGARWEDLG